MQRDDALVEQRGAHHVAAAELLEVREHDGAHGERREQAHQREQRVHAEPAAAAQDVGEALEERQRAERADDLQYGGEHGGALLAEVEAEDGEGERGGQRDRGAGERGERRLGGR